MDLLWFLFVLVLKRKQLSDAGFLMPVIFFFLSLFSLFQLLYTFFFVMLFAVVCWTLIN